MTEWGIETGIVIIKDSDGDRIIFSKVGNKFDFLVVLDDDNRAFMSRLDENLKMELPDDCRLLG